MRVRVVGTWLAGRLWRGEFKEGIEITYGRFEDPAASSADSMVLVDIFALDSAIRGSEWILVTYLRTPS